VVLKVYRRYHEGNFCSEDIIATTKFQHEIDIKTEENNMLALNQIKSNLKAEAYVI